MERNKLKSKSTLNSGLAKRLKAMLKFKENALKQTALAKESKLSNALTINPSFKVSLVKKRSLKLK